MNYILAVFLPPVALFLTRRIGHGVLSIILCIAAVLVLIVTVGFGVPVAIAIWAIAVIHAWFVIHGARVDRQIDRKLEGINE